jgi:hypothetical protein
MISLVSSSADRANAYKIQASNGLPLLSPAYISKLGSNKFICGVIDKVVAIKKFEIAFIKVALSFTHLSDKFPTGNAATLAVDHENKKGMVPVLTLLLILAVPVGFGKPAPSGSLANKETQTKLQTIVGPFKAWAGSVHHSWKRQLDQSAHTDGSGSSSKSIASRISCRAPSTSPAAHKSTPPQHKNLHP